MSTNSPVPDPFTNAPDLAWKRTFKNVASGTIAGVSVTLVGHPFDTLKVRLQTQPIKNPVYTGLADCFKKTLKWEGIGGLYKGVGSPLAGQMIFRATLFSTYYQCINFVGGPDYQETTRLPLSKYFLCGAIIGGVISFVESPIDLFKTKMQIQIVRAKAGIHTSDVNYRHVFHAGYDIFKRHGIRGTLQGLSGTWLRNIPSFSLYFGVYEMVRNYFIPTGGDVNDISFGGQLVSGGSGGFFYWVVTYPTDVVKSSMQSDELVKSNRKYRSMVDCIKRLYQEEGWRRFFRGYTPAMLRSIPASAVMLCVLETCRKYL